MESRNRTLWIVLAILAVVVCLCLAAAAAAAALWNWLPESFPAAFPESLPDWGGERQEARLEETFRLGETPELEIDNFAGAITVQAGEGDGIQVIATKSARTSQALERISVEMTEGSGRLFIQTRKPAGLSNAWVKLEIVTPAGTRLDAHSGSGSLDVRGLEGTVTARSGSGNVEIYDVSAGVMAETGSGGVSIQGVTGSIDADTGSGSVSIRESRGDIRAHTGSGGIDVSGASGQARLDTGSGGIDYEGRPEGDCRFETGSGSVRLRLPADLRATVDLRTGSGSVRVDYDVDGDVSRTRVKGTIGGSDGTAIYAHTGSGGIDLIRR
jgi:DUF4097 and DUF4098 domain-containing protein YvlB